MKIIYTIAVIVVIIGGLVWAGIFKKDVTLTDISNQMTESNSEATSTNPVANPVVTNPTPNPSPTLTQNPIVAPLPVTDSESVEWAGKYQIVEFGDIIPDSSPMKYDDYAYTDVVVRREGDAYTVSIMLTHNDKKTTIKARGIENASRVLEVYSESDILLCTLETYKSDRVNADTKFTWVNLKSQLNDGNGDVYYMKRQNL